ncbi:MAG: hypothetical protein E7616_10160 [Ruminococcaceae bacterium]|nr:hypothetical protein [Oscillospiraceae bacterium]
MIKIGFDTPKRQLALTGCLFIIVISSIFGVSPQAPKFMILGFHPKPHQKTFCKKFFGISKTLGNGIVLFG